MPYFDKKFGVAKEDIDSKEMAVIDQIWKGYKNFDAFQLSEETHNCATPQAETKNRYEPHMGSFCGQRRKIARCIKANLTFSPINAQHP